MDVDAGYARGVWLMLRWVLGQASGPLLDLPIRRVDGQVMGEVEIYSVLVSHGQDRAEARRGAVLLAADSRRLAALVEDAAARIQAAQR
jgi:hypothetical protein